MTIAAGGRIVASVRGTFGGLLSRDAIKRPEALETFVGERLTAYGETVVRVDVVNRPFQNEYVATAEFFAGAPMTVETARGLVAAAFQSWNGLVPHVSIVSPAGESPQTEPTIVPGLPDFDPRAWSPLVWGVVALAAIVVVAPWVRR